MADLLIDGIAMAGMTNCFLRRSSRARRMRIELRGDRTLLIVIPAGTREDQWLAFVLSKKQWIEHNLNKTPPAAARKKQEPVIFPFELGLVCADRKYRIRRVKAPRSRLLETDGQLDILCDRSSDREAYRLLRRWLIKQARAEFAARLEQLSWTTGFEWNRLSIRGQKTRWGSCSAKGNISLNFKMLFLPSELVDHVLLHELVHTRELNHSHRFWALLEKFDPQCSVHRAELRKAGQVLPTWLAKL